MPSPDIVCLGEPLFELNQPKGEDIFRQGHGGDTSNCAIAAARQGVKVGYITAIGADQFGESFMRLCQRRRQKCIGRRRQKATCRMASGVWRSGLRCLARLSVVGDAS